jgi:hypothetical protein
MQKISFAYPLATLLMALACPARAAPSVEDAEFYRRAASCVVVMERDALQLAARYQAGERGVKPRLVKLTENGFAFVGRAYLRGLREAEANRLKAEAAVAQKTLAPDELEQLSSSCQAEGAQLYADANGIERALVSNRAKARVDKLLAKKG